MQKAENCMRLRTFLFIMREYDKENGDSGDWCIAEIF